MTYPTVVQWKYEEAEILYRRSLGIAKATLGEDNPGYFTDLNNLAGLLQAQVGTKACGCPDVPHVTVADG